MLVCQSEYEAAGCGLDIELYDDALDLAGQPALLIMQQFVMSPASGPAGWPLRPLL
jgi:hypothetical protein